MTLTSYLGGNKMVNRVSLEVVNFKQELKRIESEVQSLANSDIEGRIIYATNELRQVTPVDTGEARKGWKNRVNRRLGKFYNGSIYNEVEHIEHLNNGHSKQAPKYFIEQVLVKIGILTPN